MTEKEKAKEITEKYFDLKWQSYKNKKYSIKSLTKLAAKQCAIIAVEEIIKVVPMYTGNLNPDWIYWKGVKEEIEKQ